MCLSACVYLSRQWVISLVLAGLGLELVAYCESTALVTVPSGLANP